VADSSGGPVSDAEHSVARTDRRTQFKETEPRTYVADFVDPGPRRLSAKVEGAMTQWVDLDVLPDRTTEHTFVGGAGLTLAGRVTDASDKPVAGAKVNVREPDRRGMWLQIVTGDDGRFSAAGLPDSMFRVGVEARGYREQQMTDVDPTAGELVVVLEPEVKFHVRLLLPDGGPAPRIVEVSEWRDSTSAARGYWTTAADTSIAYWNGGDITVRGLAAGRPRVQLQPHGYRNVELVAEVKSGAAHDFGEVRLEPAFRVYGVVVAEDGTPIPDADVWVNPERHRGIQATSAGGRPLTGADGAFEFTASVGGDVRVRVSLKGYAPSMQILHITDPPQPHRFVLTRGVVVTGRLVDTGGAPVADEWLRIDHVEQASTATRWRGSSQGGAKTDADGRFELRLEPGRYELAGRLGRDMPEPGFVVTGEAGQTLEFIQPASEK
jgi:protocatechuate 3,4-dioxygenase beta subunit